jgi:hypothetical protein
MSDILVTLWLVLGAIAFLGALIALDAVQTWWGGRSRRALGNPRLEVAPGPYALGDRVRGQVTAVADQAMTIESVTFSLACSEHLNWVEVLYKGMEGEREERRFAAAEVWVEEESVPAPRQLARGEPLSLFAEFELPRDGPPTFTSEHAEICWTMTFRAAVAEGPSVVLRASVEVAPRRRVARTA